ncbi:parallel beta-helix repeat (two copies) [Tenacibaculum sp. MAR_2009_124]|uniref:right-handed parallel beta-helix repeat-containing protein n=1 Tax=Tenacibaculum sp. MAR_2009_124 TaxID=1250059 RepID=UPI0008957ABA|nr:right-handed parallel beta-helix repeat-containing protein [Tenacibaculum sp. MAR_2009_124]SED13969.1 parallel beta-helix repeat (two copies) [Tenacibaculum sp. MAR_2009_124]
MNWLNNILSLKTDKNNSKHLVIIIWFLCTSTIFGQYQFEVPTNLRTKRNPPITQLDTQINVHVSDYGAIPNDGNDDTPGIQKALDFCKKTANNTKAIKLIFGKGVYNLHTNANKTHLINLKKANNILIEGNDAKIIIHDPLKGFFSLFNSKNIIVKNLYIDYDPLPFTQGRIVGVHLKNRTFDLKIDHGFPSLKHKMFQKASRVWGMLMDEKTPGKLKDGAPNLYQSKQFEELSGGIFRITVKSQKLLKHMEINDSYVHIARTNGRTIFKTDRSKDVTYLNITSYSSPAGTYNAGNMKEWSIIGCKVKLKKGRIHSANADCLHIKGSSIGPWVENCLFEGYSDDAVNLKSSKRYILNQVSPTEIVLNKKVKKGSILRIYNPREGILIGKFKVIRSQKIGKEKVKITLNNALKATLDVGATKKHDIAYLDSESNESFVIRNNVFKNARRYGILLQSSNGVIENNIFENLSQSAITINNGVDWGEGFVAHNITIHSNTFSNCGYDSVYLSNPNAAAITLRVVKLKNLKGKGKWYGVTTTDWKGLNNISITNNSFSYNKHALSIECSINTVIKSNTFNRNPNDLSVESNIIYKNNNSNLVFEN